MRATPVTTAIWLLLIAAALGLGLGHLLGSAGQPLPLPGWMSGLTMLALAGVLLTFALRVRRYMVECEERRREHTAAPRRHELDMVTAFRTLLFARAAIITGSLVAGFFGGELVFLLINGTGTLTGALLPTGFAALSAAVLAIVGFIAERWGKLPPEEGDAETEGPSPTVSDAPPA
ncbi:DUF3180 domain-containing protein [Helcobacillus massiliensis]|uniref:DUF3180 family protein n=1 Tax=Helcobacillus massiliensis TaxID=521392 RepID=A0A839QUY3_9MICO|nr:DUF3180 domain-containing protein [Helcobacillus massiliensis]MCG7426407.1 DUF3180 domain-containing protein [Helcobacillus sp. ACRRO]MBB3022659.1 hypothetical protein [Helcobacillus massiliensis]MCT1558252.1 DUF3180 domain-containing protein [Helcobacillus massiliensis]MCT2035509.1 DUF3180 domain-containing protein [Helcobacillus massiliensis]MCT2331996.1 DUF3180 domain-containing protein [Helcobacillus massiliensis]